LVRKVKHYFDVYERHFARFRDQKTVTMLEMGIQSGGSIELWRDYFGDKLIYHGMDINPNDKPLEDVSKNIFVHIGSQDNKTYMHELAKSIPNLDIVLDDASHQPLHQFIAFQNVYEYVQPNGVYMVEDLHTNYWKNKEFDGGPHSKITFMHYAKHLVDELNAFNSEKFNLAKATRFTSTTVGIAFYDSMVVFEKGQHKPYENVDAGGIRIPFKGEGRQPEGISSAVFKEYGVNMHH
jgi:hypothetical protein